jgi:tyrosinase
MDQGHGSPISGSATVVVPLRYRPDGDHPPFTRADVVFSDVDHSGGSYEVRLFLNNPGADGGTARDEAARYAGRFHVFGHGGCYGDAGHCDVPAPSADPTDLRPAHPLTPLTTYVTVTAALERLLAGGAALESVTLVPLSLPPRRDDRGPAPGLFRYRAVDLRTYFTPADEPAR